MTAGGPKPAPPGGPKSPGAPKGKVAPKKPPPPKTIQEEVAEAMDAFSPLTVAGLVLDCVEGHIAQRRAGTLHAKLDGTPCENCRTVLDAMTRLKGKPWPEARLKSYECGHCPNWHFALIDAHGIGIVNQEEFAEPEAPHEKCLVIFAMFEGAIRFIPTPDTCAECIETLPKFANLASVIVGQSWPVERTERKR